MSLTNLTFGDGANKALLCSMRPFMEALVAQLYSPSEDLRQVTASVLRNLSWRADPASKRALREVGAVPLLVRAALSAQKESTLKSVLSALWNLSAHCSANKADICRVEGALAFLVSTLTHRSKNKTLAIVENGGGILRNVSSHVAIQNEYRAILRRHNCLQILLSHLKSPSLTVVSNACGTLWNLSARNAVDQRALWEMGAVGMLRKLINSKHKMISMGSSAALKNLLSARPPGVGLCLMEDGVGYRGADAPSLMVRKQKALSTEIDQNLSETYDNTDSPKTSPVKHAEQTRSRRHTSPSAAKYMANQKLKAELSLPKMSESYVVEEKHNGAFQVTKNAKQALNYRQGQQARLQLAAPEIQPESKLSFRPAQNRRESHPPSAFEHGSKLSFKPSRYEREGLQNKTEDDPYQIHDESQSKLGFRPTRYDKEAPKPSEDYTRHASRSMSPMTVRKDRSAPLSRGMEQTRPTPEPMSGIPKPTHESRIPLPKSSVNRMDYQRSQSASPVVQRKNLSRENSAKNVGVSMKQNQPNHVNIPPQKPVDITVTHPKWAWTASPEKTDNVPERPGKQLEEESGGEDEIRVWRTENTPSLMSLNHDLEGEELDGTGARCSLNIRTSTGVKMIRNHPLLVNAHRNDEEGRLFDHRNRQDEFQDFESGKTVEFCVQSDYDIDETLSLMSRSSSVASISSFDQQSIHEDESFASDLSHRTSGIESPSELSESPSPLGSSHYITCNDMQPSVADRTDPPEIPNDENVEVDDQSGELEEALGNTTYHSIQDNTSYPAQKVSEVKISNPKGPSPTHRPNSVHLEAELRTNRVSRSSSSSSFSVEDISPSERVIMEECIRAGMPIAPPSYQLLGNASARRLAPPTEYESEEKGKEDERKAEKSRLFRIPESPGSYPRKGEPIDVKGSDRKMILEQMGNRRSEKYHQNKFKVVSDVPSQLGFLMNAPLNGKDIEVYPQPTVLKDDARVTEVGRNVDVVSKSSVTVPEVECSPCESSNDAGSIAEPEPVVKVATKPKQNMPVVSVEKAEADVSKTSEEKTVRKSVSEEDVELLEKDIDCSESDEIMLTSSMLGEAREIALMLGGSTEDMTVSTLSCLSDIDNARPPSVMAELGCLSLEDSVKATHVLSRQLSSTKKSLLRDLQMGRLGSSNESPENLSLRSSCASDLLANVNPPSMLDNISLTASTGSLSTDESDAPELNGKYIAKDLSSMSDRMNEAAALAQMYTKELSAITGAAEEAKEQVRISIPSAVQEVTIADVTDIGCDTVGSDTEVEEDLPCDDDETLKVTRDEGSSENLTCTLTEEKPEALMKPFMTSEEFKALQENADMILNTLKDIEVSDDEDGEHSNSGELLEDETMSLVSNESDEEFFPQHGLSPRTEHMLSPTCNGMVGLPQPLYRSRKTSLPQVQNRRSSGGKDASRAEQVEGVIDTRTFTRKRGGQAKGLPVAPGPPIPVASGQWKGRSKSADINRNSKLKMVPPPSPLHKERDGYSQRSTPSPKSPLSRSNTFEKLAAEEASQQPLIRRPSSLAISQKTNSPRNTKGAAGNALSQKPNNDSLIKTRTVAPPRTSEATILSPSGNAPKAMNKAQMSNIPTRRSFIPTPAKFTLPDN
ncbi:adenomatous polyposis coli homolog [Trichonephila inaurata madagascariensis]|uniref:Adenomatous polyposis coli homolog n=1 Tax=Trichonephila inaurata madagascariensis TaxID=2747483 RepID=A0A8X6YS01_9ARAC|nr:adenomatous polyposis coli homolog [Trichonephila inaurata madagascariensis]